MKIFLGILSISFICLAFGDKHGHEERDFNKKEAQLTEPVVGHWNVSYEKGGLCMKMDAGIRLDIEYETKFGNKSTATIFSDGTEYVPDDTVCKNFTKEKSETLALQFGKDRKLYFKFSRDHNITGDQSEQKWQLFEVGFDFKYDPETFPNALHQGERGLKTNKDPLKDVASSNGKSYGCTKTDALKVADGFTVTLNALRVQPFMTSDDFGQATWCSKDETSDLIPIIIGAALAALVIIVLIAYLVGRARARTTTYDNI